MFLSIDYTKIAWLNMKIQEQPISYPSCKKSNFFYRYIENTFASKLKETKTRNRELHVIPVINRSQGFVQ